MTLSINIHAVRKIAELNARPYGQPVYAQSTCKGIINGMLPSIHAIKSWARMRLGGHSFDAESVDRWEIAPAIKRMSRAAPCLPDDPERIFDQPSASADQTRETLAARTVVHNPTRLFRYHDVRLVNGTLYTDRAYLSITKQRRFRVATKQVPINEALVCTNYVTEHYFGHWLIDGMILEMLAEDRGVVPLTFASRRWQHEGGYRDLLNRHGHYTANARITDCVIADDRGINELWVARVQRLRATIHAKVAINCGTAPVFLSRGRGGSQRQLLNEGEVRDELDRRGFRIIEPEKLSPAEISAALHGAPLIVGVEGSHQTHAILAAQAGSSLVTIMPPRRASAYHKTHTDALGLGWAYTVADDRGDNGFHQSIDRLLRVIDLADIARGTISR